MENKQILFNDEARKKLLTGASKLAKAVVSSLGPFGRNTIYTDENKELRSTKDGVTISRNIKLEDPIENMGAEIVRQAAEKCAKESGDGTTSTTLLAVSIVEEGMKLIDNGTNVVELRKELEEASAKVVESLKVFSQPIRSEDEYKQIATISSNNDEFTGKLISQALNKAGADGVVSIEESKTGETYLETVEGMQFDRGYKSPFFVTNNNTMQSVLDDPYILVYDGRITTLKEIAPALQFASQENKPILIVAEDIDGEALSVLLVNKLNGIIKACAVKAPDFGDRRTLLMEDMAILTGGTLISKSKGMTLEKLDPKYLGKSGKVTVTKDKTTIIDGKGSIDNIQKRALEMKSQIDNAQSPFEKEKLQDRLAKLTSGVSIVYVGGVNEVEMREYKDRVEDALYATKAAIEEGVLPGGGVALFRAIKSIEFETTKGSAILRKVLLVPFKQLLSNAGFEGEQIYEFINRLKSHQDWEGFNFKTNKWEDFKSAGVIDPLKVVRLSLTNAIAVANTLLTTEAVIYNAPKQEEKKQEQDTEY